MQFIRRPDLDPPTRIHIVRLAWLHQGVYGKMTQIAKSYQISRTFLYQLLLMANLQLETLFSDEKLLFQKDHRHLDQLLLLLRSEGKCSFLSLSSILKALEYHPNSVGYLSQFFGLDHGIGHFMLVEVDSEAQAAVPPSPKSPQTS